jgi:two-component system, NarL family, response regulator
MIRLLVVEDHFLARFALVGFLSDQEGMSVVAKAESGHEAVELHRLHHPDVVLMDIALPTMDGIATIEVLRAEDPEVRVLVLSNLSSEEDIHRALEAGARGYLRKDTTGEALVEAIERIARGERYFAPDVAALIADRAVKDDLTPRERDVLDKLIEGLANRQIAEALSLRESTVRIYVSNVLVKLGAKSRTEAVIIALKRGLARKR